VSGNLKPELNGCWEPRADQVNGKDSWSKGAYFLYWADTQWGDRWMFDNDLNPSSIWSYITTSTAATPPASSTWSTYVGSSWQSDGGVSVTQMPKTPVCGDGLSTCGASAGEICDDNNTDSGDGCSEQCTVEAGFECKSAEPSACLLLRCGNGITQPLNNET
jgi:cysteine-rich repeat protein